MNADQANYVITHGGYFTDEEIEAVMEEIKDSIEQEQSQK